MRLAHRRVAGPVERSRERGAGLVELALVGLFLTFLVAATFDYGFAWRAGLAVNESARAGARVGSGQSLSAGADYYALNSLRASLTASGTLDQVEKVVIFKATTTDGKVPASCLKASPTGTCNVLTGAQLKALSTASYDVVISSNPAVAPTGTGTKVMTGPVKYSYKNRTSDTNWSATIELKDGESATGRAANLLRWQYPNVINWSKTTTTSTWTLGGTNANTDVTISAPAEYQTRATATSTTWSTPAIYLAGSDTYKNKGPLFRYRTGTYQTQSVCVPTYTTVTDPVVDDYRQSGTDNYTYTLYAADNTPLNDEDNPQICQQTFTKDSAFDGTEYLGSRRWNNLCTIGTTQPSGRYVLKVTNSGQRVGSATTQSMNDGSNQWGLVAKYATTGDGLCDGRNDVMCPRVYGKDAISVRAASTASVASFYLAEILPEHAGKKLRLELFDPGEGGKTIEIMKPSGTDGNTWTPNSFSWKADTSPATSGSNVTSLDVTNDKFNGKLVEITIDLSGYSPPANNYWWQIRYTFRDNVTVTDRTTWSARIVGDPVHLVEEY